MRDTAIRNGQWLINHFRFAVIAATFSPPPPPLPLEGTAKRTLFDSRREIMLKVHSLPSSEIRPTSYRLLIVYPGGDSSGPDSFPFDINPGIAIRSIRCRFTSGSEIAAPPVAL